MSVYEDEDKSIYDKKPDEYSPRVIKDAEESTSGGSSAKEDSGLDNSTTDAAKSTEQDEYGALNNRFKSLYNQDYPEGEEPQNNASSRGKKLKRIGIIGGAVGLPTLMFGAAVLPGLFSIFKLDTFLQNIDSSTFSRFNASFEGRSDKWVKSYIKLRMTELDGDIDGKKDTLFFRANAVDTNHPIRDWYNTLRTSSFEKEVFEKSGIRFSQAEVTGPDGSKRFVPALISIKDTPLDASSISAGWDIADALDNPAKLENLLNTKLGPDISKHVDVQLFNSENGGNKAARKAIKNAVNDHTRAWQVYKRKHLRNSIQNMTGVSKWRLFARARDKLDAKKLDLQTKILQLVIPENRTGLLIGCLLGANKCPGNTDPASPESRDPSKGNGQTVEGAPSEEIDSNGNAVQTPTDPDAPDGTKTSVLAPDGSPSAVSGETSNLVGKTTREGVQEAAENLTPMKRYMNKLVSVFVGGNPYTKIWSYLKKIAKIHNVMHGNVIGKMVLQGRRMQYMAAYASMAIALSQMKAGDIAGTEILNSNSTGTDKVGKIFADAAQNTLSLATRNGQINQYMQFFNGAEKSEAWILYSGGRTGNSAKAFAAAENGDKGRTWYCDLPEEKRLEAPVQYLCPDDGLNGGKGDAITRAYDSTIGLVIAPIATIVNEINDSVIGGLVNMVSGFMDKVLDKVTGPIIEKLLDVTGAGKLIGDITSAAMGKLLEFAGAGVKYYPGKAGQLNFMALGASSSAENTARDSGGIASTPLSLEYSNRLAADWKADRENSMSTFDKFFALSNPKSITTKALLALVTSSPKNILRDAANPGKSIATFASTLSGAVYANDVPDIEASTVADWGGVPKYDIPQVCMDLDPMDKDYLNKSTNAPEGVPRDYATLSDSAKFWDSVYSNLDGSEEEKESKAGSIYNCALLDSRVMGGLGYVHSGYNKDGGLQTTSDGASTGTETGTETTTPVAAQALNCEGMWTLKEAYNAANNGGKLELNSEGRPVKAAFNAYYSRVKQACEDRKSECESGQMPYTQKGLCEAFRYDGTWYGANYWRDEARNLYWDSAKTIQWYGLKALGSAEHSPEKWAANWKPGLNSNNFLGCTGLTTMSAYLAYEPNKDPSYDSEVDLKRFVAPGNTAMFKRITNPSEIRPGDYLWNNAKTHWVIAASPIVNNKLIIYHSSGYGRTVGFAETEYSGKWDTGLTVRWNKEPVQ